MPSPSTMTLLKIPHTDGSHTFLATQMQCTSYVPHCISFRGLLYKVLQTGSSKGHRFILSQFSRPEVQNQGVGRALLPLKALGEDLLCALYVWWLPATLGVPWLVHTSLRSVCLSSHGILLHVCASTFPSHKGTRPWIKVTLIYYGPS